MTGADLPDDLIRKPQSRKGVARKTAIIDATLRIIGRDGIQGVSMRAVASEAAVPLGTVTYYFGDKDELLEAAFVRHSQRETARIVDAIARLGGARTSADVAHGLADFVIQGLTDYREQLMTEYQFLGESARSENLRRASAAWLQSLTTHLESTVTGLSSSSPRTDARLILAVLAGLEVDGLGTSPDPANQRVVRAVLERLLQSLDALWSLQRT